jgi:hypothetical protein
MGESTEEVTETSFVRINSRLLSELRDQDLIAESFGF